MQKSELIENFRQTLPVAWDRKNTTELTGGIVNHRTLANLMSMGQGPKDTFRQGHKKVIITKDAFLVWLEDRIERNEVAA